MTALTQQVGAWVALTLEIEAALAQVNEGALSPAEAALAEIFLGQRVTPELALALLRARHAAPPVAPKPRAKVDPGRKGSAPRRRSAQTRRAQILDEARAQILGLLKKGPVSSAELLALWGKSGATLRLQLLQEAGVVKVTRLAPHAVYYAPGCEEREREAWARLRQIKSAAGKASHVTRAPARSSVPAPKPTPAKAAPAPPAHPKVKALLAKILREEACDLEDLPRANDSAQWRKHWRAALDALSQEGVVQQENGLYFIE